VEFLTETSVTVWHWWIFGVVLLVLELLAPGVFFLWIAVAAGITGLISLTLPGMAIEFQFLIFAVFAVVVTIAGRKWFASRQNTTDHPYLNQRGQHLFGRVVSLVDATQNAEARIHLDGTVWRVNTGVDLPAGHKIRITAIDGTILQAEPVRD
jgi:hypothetical protein